MNLEKIMLELEQYGLGNDATQTDKSKKYLNITRDTGEFLSVLIKATSAQTVLEIGTSNGYSTLWLASALSDVGCVYTIERNDLKAREAELSFNQAGLASCIVQLVGDVADKIDHVPSALDFIFLDADRSMYLSLAECLFEKLKEGGLLVFDNAASHEHELVDFIAWVNRQPHLSTSLVPVGKGELLVYKGMNI